MWVWQKSHFLVVVADRTMGKEKEITGGDSMIELLCPPGARTSDSVALWWDLPAGVPRPADYEVEVDGSVRGHVTATDVTVEELAADTEHAFQVRARDTTGRTIDASNVIRVKTGPEGDRLDVTSFGAVGDGKKQNTAAIQKAIDACPANGEVRVPAGVFISGALFLKSAMTLYLEEGAVIRGSESIDDYPVVRGRFAGREGTAFASLVNGITLDGGEIHDLVIAGRGRLDGSGEILGPLEESASGSHSRGRTLCIHHGRDIYLTGVTIGHSPAWCTHLVYCRGVTVNGITVNSRFDPETGRRYKVHNGDGCNPDSCTDVYIFNSTIISQDDNIAIKSGMNEDGRRVGRPSEHIRITNCRFREGLGVACGSDMSGGVRDVRVRDCELVDCAQVAQIKTPRGRGGIVEDIRFENMTHVNTTHGYGRWFRSALCLDAYYGDKEPDYERVAPVDEGTPQVRNIHFENIKTVNKNGPGILIHGLPEMPYEDIRFVNVEVESTGEPMKVVNAKNVVTEKVSLRRLEGSAMEKRRPCGRHGLEGHAAGRDVARKPPHPAGRVGRA